MLYRSNEQHRSFTRVKKLIKNIKTQVAIIGAGPAGMLLSQILHVNGIESVVLERQTQAYVEGRIRAGVLESGSVDVLREADVAERLDKEGLIHTGIEISFGDDIHRIDFEGLIGKHVVVYGQTEITKDLFAKRLSNGGQIYFEASDVLLKDLIGNCSVEFTHKNEDYSLSCDFIVGCDGFHGVSRRSIPSSVLREFERIYPFGWLGLLSETVPVADELIYANSERGFALASMRSPTRSRYYIQCSLDEKIEDWSDDRFWNEFSARMNPAVAARLQRGPSIEKSIAPLRSFVAEPMRYGNLFLAGDAAHIVPPTGAKGLNLAFSDVQILHRGLVDYYKKNDAKRLDNYASEALARVWKAERFSWWMSKLLHNFPEHSAFDKKIQRAEFDYIKSSEAASIVLAENYVGLPF